MAFVIKKTNPFIDIPLDATPEMLSSTPPRFNELYRGPDFQIGRTTLMPGARVPSEIHASYQYIRVEYGTANINIAGDTAVLVAGDVVVVPAGTLHEVVAGRAGLVFDTVYGSVEHYE